MVYYEKALNLNPDFKEAYDGYGKILLKLNKHAKALEYIRKDLVLLDLQKIILK